MANCPYCNVAMQEAGFMEQTDALGVYIAETYCCLQCGYRLERNPVYVAGADDEPPETRLVIEGG